MKGSEIILVNSEDVTDTIEEEKRNWALKVLKAFGANEKRLQEDDVKEYLMSLKLELWNNLSDQTIDILRDGKLVAQWKVPKLIRKKENNGFYYEIHLNEWALPFQMNRRR
jgi:hypothetical protein